MSESTAPSIRERSRARAEESQRQWVAARESMHRRVDAVLAMLPDLLRTEIPRSMKGWPRNLLTGIMLRYVEDRHRRVHDAEWKTLLEDSGLFERVEAGEEEPEAIRRLVAETRAGLHVANLADRTAIPEDARSMANYVGGHMGMRFRPYGRIRLLRAMTEHLEGLLDSPMPQTLEAEQRLGALELACADELEARRNRGQA